ncbi:MAG: IS3 family transposase [Isosphaeraceae bacterium]|jgi:transposase-like protein
MTKRRRFTPEFQAQVVLEVLTGRQSPAEACRTRAARQIEILKRASTLLDAAYHQPRPDEDRPRREALAELAGQWPTYGYRRLTVRLRRQGNPVNTNRLRRLMHALGLCGEAPARRPRTTGSLLSQHAGRRTDANVC